MLVILTLSLLVSQPPQTSSNVILPIPDSGWNLWLDRKAEWAKEPAYLPADVDLNRIPSRPPTGGWSMLSQVKPTVVTLPTTVEQHFWGEGGLRSYQNEYFYEKEDSAPKNGNYLGVSWWWKTIEVPKDFDRKQVVLKIRAAKQRAEVYVNQQLVGYDLVAETALECDITKAVKPGQKNTIAIRITNPGGRLDWGDWGTAKLGEVGFYAGHAFGGVDRGISLEAREPEGLRASWVMNTPDPRRIVFRSSLVSSRTENKRIDAIVIDPSTGAQIAQASTEAKGKEVSLPVRAKKAELWSPAHPKLYKLQVTYGKEKREFTFGFRWFGPDGIGSNAVLRLNGERIRVFSAISWGFWGINGLLPTPMLAAKEVKVAKSLGLNAINFHRNIAREEALDAADRLGLLRYTEPGGAMSMFWDPKDSGSTVQRYMIEKIRRMVRDHRSHPSLTVYVVQNELEDAVYKHPLAEKVIRMINTEDPSRPAILKSGLGTKGQMWMMPFDDTLYTDKGDGYSGWWDDHTVGTPDSWIDRNYVNPEQHVYRNTNAREIVDYGEMGGSGAGDNHPLMVEQIRKLGGKSYDLIDHQEVSEAYEKFLDRYGFRKAFPTVKGLFDQVGAKQFDYWKNVIQCARLSDASDYLTISGWESTAVENHSGLVDALRNPHGKPQVLADALRPVLPAIQVRRTAVNVGDSTAYDLFFLNETNRAVSGTLSVTLTAPNGKHEKLVTYPVPVLVKDVFSYPVAAGLQTPKLTVPGEYKLTFALGKNTQTQIIRAVDLPPVASAKVGVIGNASMAEELSRAGVQAEKYNSANGCRLAVVTADQGGTQTTSSVPPKGTPDPRLYRVQRFGQQDNMSFRFTGLPNGKATVTLGIVESYYDQAGKRVFDVKVNDQVVISNLDVFAAAGGKDRLYTKTVSAEVVNGELTVAPGKVAIDNAMFNTFKIEVDGKTFAYYFGDRPYTASDGVVWQPYKASVSLTPEILAKVRDGMSLIVLSDDDNATTRFAEMLANEGAFHFEGLHGRSKAPWMGSWYMVRSHALYEGLPVNTVMKGDYQVGISTSNGLKVSGPNVEYVTAYSRDHSREIAAGDVLTKLGKGRVLFHVVPRMTEAFQMRWLNNAVRYMGGQEVKLSR